MLDFFGPAGILVLVIPLIVKFLKKIPAIGTTYAPVVAFLLGIVGGLAGYFTGFAPEGMTLIQAIMTGIAIGGTSTGLYDLLKKSVRKK